MPVKFGYVGCGFMAQKVHIPNFCSLPNCEFVALAELRPKLREKVRARYKIPKAYNDHMELARDPEIEAVSVSAAFSVQGEIAKDLLLAGKHVFMEKPMAVSVAQAEEIVAASQKSGKLLMVGYMKRYDAGNELAKAAIDEFKASGELGKIIYTRNHGFCGNWVCNLDTPTETTDEPMPQAPAKFPEWMPKEYAGKYIGYLQQYTHNINLLRWVLGASDQVAVRAVDLDEDGYTGVVVFDMGGVRTLLETGGISHYRWDEDTQVYFKHGWVRAWAPPLLLKNVPAEVEIYKAADIQNFSRPFPKAGWTWSYKREAEHFIESVRDNKPVRSSAEDTLTDVKLFEEVYKLYLSQKGVIKD